MWVEKKIHYSVQFIKKKQLNKIKVYFLSMRVIVPKVTFSAGKKLGIKHFLLIAKSSLGGNSVRFKTFIIQCAVIFYYLIL